jgi:hypothetical protein
MKKNKTLLLSVLIFEIILGCNVTNKNILTMDKDCMPLIDTFFSKVYNNKAADALNDLLASNNNFNVNDSSMIDLKRKFKLINEYAGRNTGYKIVRKRELADDIAMYSCIVKYEKKFYRFIFTFYKSNSGTKIYKFAFDDNIDVEMEESLKYYTDQK